MASCSRDSTVRLWSLAPHAYPLQISILAGHPLGDILPNSGTVQAYLVSLCGTETIGFFERYVP